MLRGEDAIWQHDGWAEAANGQIIVNHKLSRAESFWRPTTLKSSSTRS
jgi:hypothetical protein